MGQGRAKGPPSRFRGGMGGPVALGKHRHALAVVVQPGRVAYWAARRCGIEAPT